MTLTLEDIKNYCKVDFDDDNELLGTLMLSAQIYVRSTAGKEFLGAAPLFDLAVKLLVEHWYDNRGIISDKSVNSLPYSIEALIDHLSLCGVYK